MYQLGGVGLRSGLTGKPGLAWIGAWGGGCMVGGVLNVLFECSYFVWCGCSLPFGKVCSCVTSWPDMVSKCKQSTFIKLKTGLELIVGIKFILGI